MAALVAAADEGTLSFEIISTKVYTTTSNNYLSVTIDAVSRCMQKHNVLKLVEKIQLLLVARSPLELCNCTQRMIS